jgi:hypothetical protein
LTPPSLVRSIAWLADRRRDPTPISISAEDQLHLLGFVLDDNKSRNRDPAF